MPNNKTRDLVTDWIMKCLSGTTKKYSLEMNLLVVDNTPAHSTGLQDNLLEEFKLMKIQFLASYTTPLLEPTSRQVISNFKINAKALFGSCFQVTERTNLIFRKFWKYHFHIVTWLKMIEKVWRKVTEKTLTSAWKKPWPKNVEYDFERFEKTSMILESARLCLRPRSWS